MKCAVPGCKRERFNIPGVVSTATCYRHMPQETREVLRAMGEGITPG